MKPFIRAMEHLCACRESRSWAEQFSSAEEAWDACTNVSWMRWLLYRTKPPADVMRRLSMRFLRLFRPLMHTAYQDVLDEKVTGYTTICVHINHIKSVPRNHINGLESMFHWMVELHVPNLDNSALANRFNCLCSYIDTVICGMGLPQFSLYPVIVKIIKEEVSFECLMSGLSPNMQILARNQQETANE